jgi:hypothetical protein
MMCKGAARGYRPFCNPSLYCWGDPQNKHNEIGGGGGREAHLEELHTKIIDVTVVCQLVFG